MSSIIRFEAPLSWPSSAPVTPRNAQQSDHGFPAGVTLAEAIHYLEEELKPLPCNATLTMDIEQPLVERLSKKLGSRTGVSLKLKMHGRNYMLTCDRWQKIEHNVYALHLSLRYWRNIERWGLGSIPQLLAGYELSAQKKAGVSSEAGGLPEWMEEMGLGATATLEDTVAIYHRRAKLVAQDTEALMRLNLLMDEARNYFSGKSG